jgi:hypothetical protein
MDAASAAVGREIAKLYEELVPATDGGELGHILPYVGAGYAPGSGRLRVLGVGINSYISPEDAGACHAEWYRTWIRDREYSFARGARRDLDRLGAALKGSERYAGLSYDSDASVYVTNAVKRYLHKETGRHADQVQSQWIDEGKAVWREELRTLARLRALPHVIVVFGEVPWGPVWSVLAELCASPEDPVFAEYRPMDRSSGAYHRVNVVELGEEAGQDRIVLLRLNHPAAWGADWKAAAALEHPEVREVLGL